jgi:probable phosphoglycerate mutase
MKLVIIRHADPDYTIDSLTEKGWREAKLLSDRVSKMNVKAFYVSPLGRAKDTASVSLKKIKREAKELAWLREFEAPVLDPESGEERIPWDWLPADWTKEEAFYDKKLWHTVPVMQSANVGKEAEFVYSGLDELLAEHGYRHEGNLFRAVEPNNDTVVLFCHFGVECVILGHLLGISPMLLWHGFCAAPTSMTTLITEERREGVAYFRMSAFGDISHLYAVGEEPAFAARFCEMFANTEERHD